MDKKNLLFFKKNKDISIWPQTFERWSVFLRQMLCQTTDFLKKNYR